MSFDLGRPTVDQVASLLRSRTKDSNGIEVGTFDDDTRPTSDQVESHIDAAMLLIGMRLPPLEKLPADLLGATAEVVALEAACRIEKTFWPEQLGTNRSPYAVLKQERDDELEALTAAASAAVGGSEYEMPGITMIPVGSWTSIPPAGGWAPAP